jgi:hypothetical protein
LKGKKLKIETARLVTGKTTVYRTAETDDCATKAASGNQMF